MEDRNERFKQIRKMLGMNQKEFGEKIGLSRDAVANIENRRTEVKSMTKSLLRKYYGVDLDWFETGNGEMFTETARENDIMYQVGKLFDGETDSFKKRLISILISLDDEYWEVLENIALKTLKKEG